MLKIIMNSGKEYVSEKDKTVTEFVKRTAPSSGFGVNYISLDLKETIYINGSQVSSIEIIEDKKEIEYDEDDEIVYT